MKESSNSRPIDDEYNDREDDNFFDLMHRVRTGSEDAAWEIVEKYGGYIRRAVRRVLHPRLRSQFDSLDFVQLVWKSFFRMHKEAERFQKPQHLATFLIGMAYNKVQMETRRQLDLEKRDLRREVRLNSCPGEDGRNISGREPGPADVAIARERWERLVEGHPAGYREIITLRLQGQTHAEIATKLGLSEDSVCRFLKRLLEATGE